jgi:hypothetical protein
MEADLHAIVGIDFHLCSHKVDLSLRFALNKLSPMHTSNLSSTKPSAVSNTSIAPTFFIVISNPATYSSTLIASSKFVTSVLHVATSLAQATSKGRLPLLTKAS